MARKFTKKTDYPTLDKYIKKVTKSLLRKK